MSSILNTFKESVQASLVCLVCFAFAIAAHSQDRWGVEGQYITRNGSPVFLTGANYIPPVGWFLIMENWNPADVEKDMAAMHKLGVTNIRFPLLWTLFQPNIEELSKEKLDRINQLILIAHHNGISVQVGPITGQVSGAIFLPKWADGDLFTDPKIIQGEQRLVSDIARGVKDNPGLQGYDFGNEVDCLASEMKLHPTPEQAGAWMQTIYKAFRDGDQRHPVTDGLCTLFREFNLQGDVAASDYVSVHSYSTFDGTTKMDPWLGQRSTYDTNLLIAYAASAGKPVLLQENGVSELWQPRDDIPKSLRQTLMSVWAQGATGFFWWGSHDIDQSYRLPTQYATLKYSMPNYGNIPEGIFASLEYKMGLLDIHNKPNPVGLEYQRWIPVIKRLGLGWKNDLPVAYLIYPEKLKDSPYMAQLTAFTLAKQAHMEVRMWPESKPIPSDAAAVIIPDIALSNSGRTAVKQYLENGGVVYQSWACDFSEALAGKNSGATLTSPAFIATDSAGMFPESGHIRVAAQVKLMDISPVSNQQAKVVLEIPAASAKETPRPVFFKTSVGKGTYYYLAVNLEGALAKTYNPWDQDDSNLIYSVLRPETSVTIDNKFVEFFVKSRGADRIFLMLNRSDRFQDVVFRSDQSIRLRDYTTHAPLGEGTEVSLHLMPGEVLIAESN
jgi:hypothetical protein